MDVLDGGRGSASPAVATVNGTSTVFLGSYNGNFYAINAVTGTKIWSFRIDIVNPCNSKRCRIGSSASVDVANNLVFFGAENAYLYALNATTGVWCGSSNWAIPRMALKSGHHLRSTMEWSTWVWRRTTMRRA